MAGLKISAAVCSHIGGRKNNEDNFYFNGLYMERAQMDMGGQFHKEFSSDEQIYAVCDGMGGAEFGEEASLHAARMLKAYQNGNLRHDQPVKLQQLLSSISEGIDQISFSHDMPSGASGSTMAMLVFGGHYVRTVHIGDSRVYRISQGKFEQITKDHSEVQQMIDAGELRPEHAWQHPRKNVITRHLGMPLDDDECLMPEISERMELLPEERFLICSDGLSDVVHDEVICQILTDNKVPADAAGRLVRQALIEANNLRIQSDNITVIVLDVKRVAQKGSEKKQIRKLKIMQKLLLIPAAALLAEVIYIAYDVIRFLLK